MNISDKLSGNLFKFLESFFDIKKGLWRLLICSLLYLFFNIFYILIFKENIIKDIINIPIGYRIYLITFSAICVVYGIRYSYGHQMGNTTLDKLDIILLATMAIFIIVYLIIYGPYPSFISQISKKVHFFLFVNGSAIILLPAYAAVLRAMHNKKYMTQNMRSTGVRT